MGDINQATQDVEKDGHKDVADFLSKIQRKNEIMQQNIKAEAARKHKEELLGQKLKIKFNSRIERKMPS